MALGVKQSPKLPTPQHWMSSSSSVLSWYSLLWPSLLSLASLMSTSEDIKRRNKEERSWGKQWKEGDWREWIPVQTVMVSSMEVAGMIPEKTWFVWRTINTMETPSSWIGTGTHIWRTQSCTTAHWSISISLTVCQENCFHWPFYSAMSFIGHLTFMFYSKDLQMLNFRSSKIHLHMTSVSYIVYLHRILLL